MKATEEQKEKFREYYLRTDEVKKAYAKKYYQEHREQMIAYKRRYWQLNKERLSAKCRNRNNKNRALLKREVLVHYGNGKCVCVKCGFQDIKALSIDHLGGRGNKHRVHINNFYRWLKQGGYPRGYQTLCMNCQFIKKIDEGENAYGTKGGDCIA